MQSVRLAILSALASEVHIRYVLVCMPPIPTNDNDWHDACRYRVCSEIWYGYVAAERQTKVVSRGSKDRQYRILNLIVIINIYYHGWSI